MLDATPVAVRTESTEVAVNDEHRSERPSRRRRNVADAPPPSLSAEAMTSLEAVLFASDRPLPDARLAEVLDLEADSGVSSSIERAVADLNADLERTGRVVRIRRLAGGWRVVVPAAHADAIERLKGQRQQAKLSPAALETLAIVAYRQPIIRADIESIRGVASGEVLRGLLERRLVRITGRAEELGRPMLYGTTREFLAVFGLASLADLPQRKEFAAGGASRARRGGSTSREPGRDSAVESEPSKDGSSDPAETGGSDDGSTAAGPAASDGSAAE